MKIMYFHCFSGISGDMLLGSLIDAGIELDELKMELKKLTLEGFELDCKKITKKGISGTMAKVKVNKNHPASKKERTLEDVWQLLDESKLNAGIVDKSKKIFKNLALAEASVHNTSIDKIHFHEVGAIDSIVDIVGSVIGISMFNADKIISSPLHLGKGFVNCSHGLIPVPAPATLELTKNVPVYSRGIESELTTPTGAAIITSLSHSFDDLPPMIPKEIGYGAGDKDISQPNLLRLIIGEMKVEKENIEEDFTEEDTITVIETNIDDMNPEYLQHFMELCFRNGALDVYYTPVYMKKNRPATLITVLTEPKWENNISDIIFKHTTSLGVRKNTIKRNKLERRSISIDTSLGAAIMKLGYKDNKLYNWTPEYESALDLAKKHDRPLKEVYDIIVHDFFSQKTL